MLSNNLRSLRSAPAWCDILADLEGAGAKKRVDRLGAEVLRKFFVL
jgi:hypothetical protein